MSYQKDFKELTPLTQIIVITVLFVLTALSIQLGWNLFLAKVFGMPVISFTEAVGATSLVLAVKKLL